MSIIERGLPIGAYTSQPLGNYIISPVDHTMKEVYRVKCLHRYCDDCVMLASSKAEAKFLLRKYDEETRKLGLEIKSSSFYAPIKSKGIKTKKRKRQRGGRKRD